jgi:hypothetical protein
MGVGFNKKIDFDLISFPLTLAILGLVGRYLLFPAIEFLVSLILPWVVGDDDGIQHHEKVVIYWGGIVYTVLICHSLYEPIEKMLTSGLCAVSTFTFRRQTKLEAMATNEHSHPDLEQSQRDNQVVATTFQSLSDKQRADLLETLRRWENDRR